MADTEMSSEGNGRTDEIDLRQFIAGLWHGRWVIVATTAVAFAIAVAIALTAQPVYRAEALVQVRQESKTGGGLAAQLEGIASLAGGLVEVSNARAISVATLKSRVVVENFLQEKELLPKLYERAWDPDSKQWRNPDPKVVPTVWQAYNDFTSAYLKVTEDKKTGLITIAVEWRDPEEAREWVTELISRTNARLKSQAIADGERNLAYLQDQLRAVNQLELQRALYGLIEMELKKLMLAKGGDEYAFVTIDPAVVPKQRIRPMRRQIVVLGFLIGGGVGVVMALLRSSRKRTRRS